MRLALCSAVFGVFRQVLVFKSMQTHPEGKAAANANRDLCVCDRAVGVLHSLTLLAPVNSVGRVSVLSPGFHWLHLDNSRLEPAK